MRRYSLAYLTAASLSVPQMLATAARLGYQTVGLRLHSNAPGAQHHHGKTEFNMKDSAQAKA